MKKLVSVLLVLSLVCLLPCAFAVEPDIRAGSMYDADPDDSKLEGSFLDLAVNSTYVAAANAVIVSVTGGTVSAGTVSGWDVTADLDDTAVVFIKTDSGSTSVQELLRGLVFSVTGMSMNVDITADSNGTSIPASGVVTAGIGVNDGHYYMFVPFEIMDTVTFHKTWFECYNEAKQMYFLGMKGYLATMTSAAEDRLLTSISDISAWSGGTRIITVTSEQYNDPDTVSAAMYNMAEYYYWACGPEASLTSSSKYWDAYNYLISDGTIPGVYANWWREEPNNWGDENCMQLNKIDTGYPYEMWNDLPGNNGGFTNGYFVEFGGYPDDRDKIENYDDAKHFTLSVNNVTRLGAPISNLESGSYDGIQNLIFSNIPDGGVVRYTTDDTAPNGRSPIFEDELDLSEDTVINAAVFADGKIVSEVVRLELEIDAEIPATGENSPVLVAVAILASSLLLLFFVIRRTRKA